MEASTWRQGGEDEVWNVEQSEGRWGRVQGKEYGYKISKLKKLKTSILESNMFSTKAI